MTNRLRFAAMLALAVLCVMLTAVQSSVAQRLPSVATISYQGLLSRIDGTPYADGRYQLLIRLYDSPTTGTLLFEERQSIVLKRGLFSIMIGDVEQDALRRIDFSRPVWLELAVDNEPPFIRTKLGAVPHAMTAERAAVAGGLDQQATGVVRSINGGQGDLTVVGRNGIVITQRGDSITIDAPDVRSAITRVWSSDSTLTSTNPTGPIVDLSLRDGAVTSAKLGRGSVTREKIAFDVIPSTLPPSGRAGGDLAGEYPNPSIADQSVRTRHLAEGSVTSFKIAANNVLNGNLADNAVNTRTLDNAAVTTRKIANGAVTTSLVADTAITTPKLALGAVTTAVIADSTITTAKLGRGSITTEKLADGAVNLRTKVNGILPHPLGGTGLDTLGRPGQVLRTNVDRSKLEYATLTGVPDSAIDGSTLLWDAASRAWVSTSSLRWTPNRDLRIERSAQGVTTSTVSVSPGDIILESNGSFGPAASLAAVTLRPQEASLTVAPSRNGSSPATAGITAGINTGTTIHGGVNVAVRYAADPLVKLTGTDNMVIVEVPCTEVRLPNDAPIGRTYTVRYTVRDGSTPSCTLTADTATIVNGNLFGQLSINLPVNAPITILYTGREWMVIGD
jgi:hypothetical protein